MSQIGFYRDENNDLNVQGLKISSLAEKYGTPLFIYDAGLMKERYEIFLDTVKDIKGNIHYEDIDKLLNVTKQIEGHTICALGDAAAWPIQGLMRHFRPEVEKRIKAYSEKKEVA